MSPMDHPADLHTTTRTPARWAALKGTPSNPTRTNISTFTTQKIKVNWIKTCTIKSRSFLFQVAAAVVGPILTTPAGHAEDRQPRLEVAGKPGPRMLRCSITLKSIRFGKSSRETTHRENPSNEIVFASEGTTQACPDWHCRSQAETR